ncbi:MAG: efflux RND transporter periplasmic adaptor subunit [Desulfobacterales bacterium]|nr:efflux RND transporter periplasmic adaptor subunit [Desulfobacterales bacterium]
MEKSPRWFKTALRLVSKSIPFLCLLLFVGLVILPLSQKISNKRQALAEEQSRQGQMERKPINVATLEILPKPLAEKLSFPGVAKPWISLKVVSEARGQVVEKPVQEGDRVKKGDVLARLDSRDYQNAYDAALASHETAQITKKRLVALSSKKFVTQSKLDDAVAQVKTTRANLATARLNLERCTIRSPMDGVVDRSDIEVGTYLQVGDPVFTLLQLDKIKVAVGIPESDVDAVRRLKTFRMTLDALDNRPVTGSYHYLTRTTDSLARLYTLDIRVDNPDQAILPDMFSRVEIVKNQVDDGLAVPIYALVTRRDEKGVFVENQGKVRFQPVETGFQDGWEIQITRGLNPGDRVVVVGHRIIEDGETVQVTQSVRTMEELTR